MSRSVAVSFVAVLLVIATEAHATPPGSWVTYGHDFQRTGRADGVGKMHAPTVAWTVPLGGILTPQQALVSDVDGDGRPETVTVSGGRVVATRANGATLWSTVLLGPTAVLGAWDLDGTGQIDVVVDATVGVLVLSGKDGHTLTTLATTAPVEAAFAKEATGGILVLSAASGPISGYDFRSGTSVASPTWTITGSGQPSDLVGDVDGDGSQDLVRPLVDGFEVDNPITGISKYSLPGMGPIAYYYLYELANVDGKPGDEIVAIDPSYIYSPDTGIYVLGVVGGQLKTLWSSTGTASVALGVDFFSVAGSVADVNGDGKLELVYSRWDGTANTWTTTIADAAAGTILGTIPGAFLQAVADIDGDGKAEVVTRSGVEGDQLPIRSTLSAYDFDSPQTGPVAKPWAIQSAHVTRELSVQTPGPGIQIPVVADFDTTLPGLEMVVGVDQSNANADTSLLVLNGATGSAITSYPIPANIGASIIGVANDLTGMASSNDIVVTQNDGTVHLLDSGLVDHVHFGAGTYSNWLHAIAGAAGTANAFVATSDNQLLWIDGRLLHTDGTPYIRFKESQVVSTSAAANSGVPLDPVVLLNGTAPRVVTFEQGPNNVNIVAHSATGVEVWRAALGPGNVSSPGAYALDLTGDGNDDLLFCVVDPNSVESIAAYDGTSGGLITSLPISSVLANSDALFTGSLVDVNGDGHLDLVTPEHSEYDILAINLFARPFAEIWLATPSPIAVNGTVGVASVGDGGGLSLLRSNGNNGFGPYERLTLDGGFVATGDQGLPATHGYDQNAAVMVGTATLGAFDLVSAGTADVGLSRIRRISGDTLATVWTQYAAEGSVSSAVPSKTYALHDPVVLDVDGNGVDDVVFGSDDGYLYAVSSVDGSLVFDVNLNAPVLHVIAANVDLDPELELVVSLSDGRVMALDDTYVASRDMPDAGVDGSADASGTEAGGDASDVLDGGEEGGGNARPGSGCGCIAVGDGVSPYGGLLALGGIMAALGRCLVRRRP